jgi:hypothetical protein
MSQNLLDAPERRAGFAPFNGLQLNSMLARRLSPPEEIKRGR